MTKGIAAGLVNTVIALGRGAAWSSVGMASSAAILGFAVIGVSLVMFALALRHLGTARTGACFSLAPFIGAIIAVAMGEPLTVKLGLAERSWASVCGCICQNGTSTSIVTMRWCMSIVTSMTSITSTAMTVRSPSLTRTGMSTSPCGTSSRTIPTFIIGIPTTRALDTARRAIHSELRTTLLKLWLVTCSRR
jgi:drug/metabolite transporter (DMT)-like permease